MGPPRAGNAVPVYLLCHEEGLAEWLGGLDGVFLVAATGDHAADYGRWTVVDAEPGGSSRSRRPPWSVSGCPTTPRTATLADVFDRRDARMVAGLRSEARSAPAGRPEFPPLLHVDGVRAASSPSHTAPTPDPLDLLVAESAQAQRRSPSWEQPSRGGRAPARLRARLPLLMRRHARPSISDAELAALLVARAPTLVVIGSRKGGVGKTSHAAGIAIAAGGVLDSVGHRAAIVDGNVANPDAWGQLNLPAEAASVRDVVTALVDGSDPPPPVHAVTPALACYPERRDGVDYGRVEIQRLAAHLRRYAFIVVDMSDRLPDPTAGPEAAVAAFWLEEADALVLPTGSAVRISMACSTTSTSRACRPRSFRTSPRRRAATGATR